MFHIWDSRSPRIWKPKVWCIWWKKGHWTEIKWDNQTEPKQFSWIHWSQQPRAWTAGKCQRDRQTEPVTQSLQPRLPPSALPPPHSAATSEHVSAPHVTPCTVPLSWALKTFLRSSTTLTYSTCSTLQSKPEFAKVLSVFLQKCSINICSQVIMFCLLVDAWPWSNPPVMCNKSELPSPVCQIIGWGGPLWRHSCFVLQLLQMKTHRTLVL